MTWTTFVAMYATIALATGCFAEAKSSLRARAFGSEHGAELAAPPLDAGRDAPP
jgi:hypothetical protein